MVIISLGLFIFFVCTFPPGGADKSVVVFNKDTEQVTAVMKGHTKKVTNVIYHPTEVSIVVTGTVCGINLLSKEMFGIKASLCWGQQDETFYICCIKHG